MIDKLLLVLSIAATATAKEICYRKLGCFTDGPPYSDTLERPFSCLPWPPEVIGTQFLLFSRVQDAFKIVTVRNLSSSTFSPSKKSCFIIHGYLDNGYEPWIVAMCKSLLQVSDVNCFSVNWNYGAHALYPQAANNVRVVGAELAFFIDSLLDADYSLSDIYLIGHSLGAHVVGEAGKRRPGIARISGLDPAGPYFQDTPPEVRLNPTDAVFVDVIHTNGWSLLHFGFGMTQPVGHLDFYPNGGQSMPGCDELSFSFGNIDDMFDEFDDKVTCNHRRSHQLFQESILQPYGFIGYPATSYSAFQQGAGFPCSNKSCAIMGYYADGYTQDPTMRWTFYLVTGDTNNFLRWRYHVSITIAGSEFVLGSLSVSLCGKKICSSRYEIYSGLLRSGSTYSSFIDVELDVKPIQKVEFIWHKMALYFLHPKLGASAVVVQYGPSGAMCMFCADDLTEEDENQTLEKCSLSHPLTFIDG
ncbi:pancreatic lipase-related protein 2-like [Rana temporaria]|uniref:pancreatic lipase-related protein 2-like n=1 Tax=Rana temporaria TaxID=8407 RepID=UPI001AACB696|nr:pancreatic lipase-related protein 2-like [Rana temporaria]